MAPDRPDPDALLARLRAGERPAGRGRLKVFFGYAAGVGKTYAMLEAARRAKSAGREVVVGYVEPHGRAETEALLDGLEALPTRGVEHAGVVLREFDVDAALARRPGLILVDELAHTNAPGCRHAKRWQDVAELLDAGIDVWTTLNVQHIESLNTVIGQVTGVTVRETVPDRVFETADELELADLPPDDLLGRLRAGKVYRPDQAERAVRNFFQKANLVALRELSLRQAAKRVHAEVETARQRAAVNRPWATADRLLVCVGPSPTTARVIRTAKRMADALDAPWLAVNVEQPGTATNPAAAQQVADHIRLAERLGAETVTLTGTGEGVAATVLDYARTRNVTKVLVGKTGTPRWRRWLGTGVVEELLAGSGDIDVYLVQGADDGRPPPPAGPASPAPVRWPEYLAATGAVAGGLAAAAGLDRLGAGEANVVMAFLAAVVWVAFRHGRGPAVWACAASVLAFDFFFVPPYLSLTVADARYLVTFAVMLVVGLLVSALTARLRTQLDLGRRRERRTLALHRLGKQLSSLAGDVFLVAAAGQHLRETTGGEVAVYLAPADADPKTPPAVAFGADSPIATHPVSGPAAHWVMTHDRVAGRGTDTLPNAAALFVPLTGSQSTFGAVAVRVGEADRLLQPDERQWLENCAGQLALALERDRMTVRAADARLRAETEQVRSTLLGGVSHDLKTPLAAIAGAASTLLRLDPTAAGTRRELLETVADEAARLNRLLENILQIARLDAGAVAPNRQWHVLEDIVGSALRRAQPLLDRHRVEVRLPEEMALVFVDGLLMEQVFANLLENAARYTPAGSHVVVSAYARGREFVVTVADDGPGLPPGPADVIFDRFRRGATGPDAGRGSGLGLAICRAIVGLHGGTIRAADRPGGGAEFTIRLPPADDPPPFPEE